MPKIFTSLKSRLFRAISLRHKSKKLAEATAENERPKVLVLGIYLGYKESCVEHIVENIRASKACVVDQKWVALGDIYTTVADVTVSLIRDTTPKFTIVNGQLAGINKSVYDYIVLIDDDVCLPVGFIDSLITAQRKLNFDLAQPARTLLGYFDHSIVLRRPWLFARETSFVEIGPVVSISSSIFDILIPFDETSPMGWGYDFVWPVLLHNSGKKMGIVDAVPVAHGIRKRGEAYSWLSARDAMAIYLGKNEHLNGKTAFTVVKRYFLWKP